jgi:hypothetical protein
MDFFHTFSAAAAAAADAFHEGYSCTSACECGWLTGSCQVQASSVIKV